MWQSWLCWMGFHDWHCAPDKPLNRCCLACEKSQVADVFGWVNTEQLVGGRIRRCITCNRVCDGRETDWFWNGDDHGQEHWKCRRKGTLKSSSHV